MRLDVRSEYITKIDVFEALKKIFRALFNHENRIRPVYKVLFNYETRLRVLEAKPAITEAQFLSAIEGLDQMTKQQFINILKTLLVEPSSSTSPSTSPSASHSPSPSVSPSASPSPSIPI